MIWLYPDVDDIARHGSSDRAAKSFIGFGMDVNLFGGVHVADEHRAQLTVQFEKYFTFARRGQILRHGQRFDVQSFAWIHRLQEGYWFE